MHLGMNEDGITTEEEVELNYEQNYVRVNTPGRNGASPIVIVHDYNRVIICLLTKHSFFFTCFMISIILGRSRSGCCNINNNFNCVSYSVIK